MTKKVSILCAIDQGTTSTRVILFDSESLQRSLGQHQLEHEQFFPHPGWVEHSPLQIIERVQECLQKALEAARDALGKDKGEIEIKAIGITNQRETTVVWDKTTGKPLYNAIGINLISLYRKRDQRGEKRGK